jgi:hypothetical protein
MRPSATSVCGLKLLGSVVQALQAKADALEEKAGDMRTKLAVAQAQLAATEDDVRRRQVRDVYIYVCMHVCVYIYICQCVDM